MEVADRYWGNLLILSCIVVLNFTGNHGSEIVLTSTYQRGTKICKPVFNCHHGKQIKECVSSMQPETCEKCPDDLVQPDLISSVLKHESHRKCFRLQEARCSTKDTVPAREKDQKVYCAKYCKCDITKCFWGETSCDCKIKMEGCPPNFQLNGITGECERCPNLTYKHGNYCGPCEYNETAFNIYVNDNLGSTVTPKPTTGAPTTPKVKPTTTPKPLTSTPKVGGHNRREKEGLSSVAIIIIAVLVVVLLILITIILILFCCYWRGLKCKEILKRPFANGQVNGQLNGHLKGTHRNVHYDDKLYEEMSAIPPPNGHIIGCEQEPLVRPEPPPLPNHSPIRAPSQVPPLPAQWTPPISNGYMSAVGNGQDGLRVTLPRQISHPVQDTTPHTPGSGGSASLTDNLEAMHYYPLPSYPGPGISQQPIHAGDERVSDGIDTNVKQQSSPILCTEDNNLLPNFSTNPTHMSTEEFVHQHHGYFQPGAGAHEHGENAAKENEEETQPKQGNQSANSSLQRTENDHFVSLNQGTDKKHLMPSYTEVDKQAAKGSVTDKVNGGANYIDDAKVSPSYIDMEKKLDSSVDKDAYQDEAYESVGPSNVTNVTKDSKDNSIASNHSHDASGKS